MDVLLTLNTLPSESGAAVGVLVTDLTAHKHHEALATALDALRVTEERFRTHVEQVKDYAIFQTDINGLPTTWNEGVRRVLGFEEREFIGIDIVPAIFEPEDVANGVAAQELADAAESGTASHDHWMRKQDGTRFWGTGVTTALRDHDGKHVGFTRVMRDQTDWKRAVDMTHFLASASATLAELVDYDSSLSRIANLAVREFADWCLVDVLDEDGNRRHFSVTRAGGSARATGDMSIPGGDDPYGVAGVLRTGKPALVSDVAARARDRHPPLASRGVRSYVCVPLRSRGTVIGAMTFVSAGSGRSYGQEELQTAMDLAGRVGVALDNARLYQTVQDADRRKEEFLATLAHELRNPLAPIRTGLQIVKLAPPGGHSAAKAQTMMERQLVHMVRLIDDLLDISRVSKGKIELRREHVTLRAVVESAIETSRSVIDASHHEFTVTLPEAPIRLHVDLTRLAQVVGNILTNAAKYTPDGGRIELVAGCEDGEAFISVSDTGVGLALDMQAKVFEMFAQVNRSIDRAQGGLGVGLALAKRLVEMHGGTIAVDSPGPGQGSTFTIRVPAACSGADSAAPAVATTPAAPRQRRILVVDDNKDGAETLAMLLDLSGHTVRVAHDGPQALVAAREFRPEIAFLDIGLPGMSGYELAKRFRADAGLRGTFLVALTGWGSADDKERSRVAGFDFHLTKPVEPAAVDEVLARLSSLGDPPPGAGEP